MATRKHSPVPRPQKPPGAGPMTPASKKARQKQRK